MQFDGITWRFFFRRDSLVPLSRSVTKRKMIEGTSFLTGYSRMRKRVLKHFVDGALENETLFEKIDF
jgi:hypothetical protein